MSATVASLLGMLLDARDLALTDERMNGAELLADTAHALIRGRLISPVWAATVLAGYLQACGHQDSLQDIVGELLPLLEGKPDPAELGGLFVLGGGA